MMNHGYQGKTGAAAPLLTPRGGSAGRKDEQHQAIRFIGDMQRLKLEPEDIVVLSLEHDVTKEMAERLREMVKAVVGADREVLILSGGIKIGVLAKEEA
jgi:hypothetical protein